MALEKAPAGFLAWYPLPLVALAIWTCIVGGTIVLLEASARYTPAPQPTKGEGVWYFGALPNVLLTLFAQGHGAVTAAYLGRLAISALQDTATAPQTWVELFWLSNQSWKGPVGLGKTLWTRRNMPVKTPLSSTFIAFAVTMLFTLPTPVALSRAYPAWGFFVDYYDMPASSSIVATGSLPNDVGWVAQLAVGSGGWSTGLDAVQDMYVSRIYLPSSAAADSIGTDTFFSGALSPGYHDASLPGIRTTGGCSALDASNDSALRAGAGQATSGPPQAFSDWCSARGLGQYIDSFALQTDNVDVYMHWCTGLDPTTQANWTAASQSSMTIIGWLNATDGQTAAQGFLNCSATFSVGNATVSAGDSNIDSRAWRTFDQDHFTPVQMYDPVQGAPFFPPVFAAFFEISQLEGTNGTGILSNGTAINTERAGATARMLGYTPNFHPNGTLVYNQPMFNETLASLWRGTMHMSAAIGVLGSQPGNILSTYTVFHQGRQRQPVFVVIAGVLLSGWLTMLVLLTMRLYRRTFGDSLDSYTAARLLVDKPSLVEGYSCGSLVANPNLGKQFSCVGDLNPDGDVGHVGPGGPGQLKKDRNYGTLRDAAVKTGVNSRWGGDDVAPGRARSSSIC